ncbi:hypothetical protein ACIPY6_28580 [Streptomyces sp. NPDC090054]|uniref:hypothetical protein n=1 Tax=Streptomyces sp. NPDC090054 TaxID=3365933 RepID=UPI00382BE14F
MRSNDSTPLHLSNDGALLLSLIEPHQLHGPIVEAYEMAGGLVTVESTPNGWLGDYRITAWMPLSVRDAEDRQHEVTIDRELADHADPDGRLPLILDETVTDVATLEQIAGAVREARLHLLDRAAHAASTHVRGAKAIKHAQQAAALLDEVDAQDYIDALLNDTHRMIRAMAS